MESIPTDLLIVIFDYFPTCKLDKFRSVNTQFNKTINKFVLYRRQTMDISTIKQAKDFDCKYFLYSKDSYIANCKADLIKFSFENGCNHTAKHLIGYYHSNCNIDNYLYLIFKHDSRICYNLTDTLIKYCKKPFRFASTQCIIQTLEHTLNNEKYDAKTIAKLLIVPYGNNYFNYNETVEKYGRYDVLYEHEKMNSYGRNYMIPIFKCLSYLPKIIRVGLGNYIVLLEKTYQILYNELSCSFTYRTSQNIAALIIITFGFGLFILYRCIGLIPNYEYSIFGFNCTFDDLWTYVHLAGTATTGIITLKNAIMDYFQ